MVWPLAKSRRLPALRPRCLKRGTLPHPLNPMQWRGLRPCGAFCYAARRMVTQGKSLRATQPGAGKASASGGAILTSRDNRWLKEFRMALRGGLPTESGAVGVEGVRLVEEALRSGCPVQAVLFSESGERHRERLDP